jgi:hypothetical protein
MIEDSAVRDALDLLRREWGHGYLVWYQAGRYCAMRRDNGAICRRPAADELRVEMATDYQLRPVRTR